MFGQRGANEFTIKDIENFLDGEGVVTPTTEENESSPATQPNESDAKPVVSSADNVETPVTETQTFARRLKEATNKARNDERESIAKSLGYESYDDMQKKHEAEMLREKGLDPEEVSPIVQQLVEQRLAQDPRLQELDSYRDARVAEWGKRELAELKELTDGRIAKLEDVPKDVIELWKTKGSLKGAYIELYGERRIREMQAGIASGQNRSTTSHLASPQGTPTSATSTNKRPFTQQERDVYKLFNPDVTDDELSKLFKET